MTVEYSEEMIPGGGKLRLGREAGGAIVRLDIVASGATLQDLLDVWQPLCDDAGIYKTYAAGHFAPCRACEQNCCLAADISPDIIALRRLAQGHGITIPQFLERYCQPEPLARGLIKLNSYPCVFLRDDVCTVYPWRTLLCRFYICCAMAGATQELIYRISLLGAAASHHYARAQGFIPAPVPAGLGGFDRAFLQLMEESMAHPALQLFLQAEDYTQIPLAVMLQ